MGERRCLFLILGWLRILGSGSLMLDCVDRACILFPDDMIGMAGNCRDVFFPPYDDEVVQIDLWTLLGAMTLVSRAVSRRRLDVCWRHRAILTSTTWAIALG